MLKKISTLLLVGTACLSSACATTAKGVSQSSFTKIQNNQTLNVSAPKGTVLAVVRYPAFVDDAAKDAYYKAFNEKAIGGSPVSSSGSPEMQALADSVVLKSNYFALSVFKELAAKLPEHSVLLSPHKIELDSAGGLTSSPMTQAENLPNVVSVDFTSYTFPDSKKMMGKAPLTFGDLITPLLTVRTNHHASVPTHGLLMASAPLLSGASGNGRTAVSSNLQNLQKGALKPSVKPLDFIAHLTGKSPMPIASKSFDSRMSGNSVVRYPVEKIKLDKTAIQSLKSNNAASVDPINTVFSKSFANQIVSVINTIDIDKATLVGRAAAISQFDESLAALTLVGGQDADYQARLRYAERLLEAEQKYLSVQSLRLFDGVQNGEIGAQVRDMIVAEHKILQERRKLAKQQNTATALAILGAVAAGATIANESKSERGVSYGESLAINTMIQGAIFAGQQAYSKSRQSRSVGNNYLSSIVPALEEQTSVQVNLIDSNETITAIRYEDLKAKLQTLYNEKQRSLDSTATRCAFTYKGQSKSGTWLGECENGLANGSGVGVLKETNGSDIEYYGYAQNGKPEGAGYLLVHKSNGSEALEGQFSQGKANGVMRLSMAGRPDQIRRFSQGQNMGEAPAGIAPLSPFNAASQTAPIAIGLTN